jgi:hypothetical protein
MLPLPFPGLPSLHGMIEAIAGGFFGALAHALVPSFLTHAGVATIQALVALPDPATWPHVSELQGEMTFLGVLLLPVTLAAGVLRYWLLGLTGGPSPVLAVGRAGWATGLLVAYRWIVEQVVAAANTLTHAILGFPAVSAGLSRIVTVLFGGSLLVGAGGVFGALLVIVGVVFAAALFAAQVLVTLVLALLTVAGPLLIAVSAIPELSHLARSWAHALLAVALIPVGWTVLFATAGALALDATSFTGGAGGLPEHVAAAFAGLITFVLAVRLPIVLFTHARHLMFAAAAGGRAGAGAQTLPGAERVSAAQARLRSVAFDAAPAVGRTVGVAAGALGAPAGGPVGAIRRRVTRMRDTGQQRSSRSGGGTSTRGVRARVALAASTLRDAPRQARDAMNRQRPRPVTATPVRAVTPGRSDGVWLARRGSAERHRGRSSSTRPARTQRPTTSDTAGSRVTSTALADRRARAAMRRTAPVVTRLARPAGPGGHPGQPQKPTPSTGLGAAAPLPAARGPSGRPRRKPRPKGGR